MCGRFITGADEFTWREYCDLLRFGLAGNPPAERECFPGGTVPVVCRDQAAAGPELLSMSWGFLPSKRQRSRGTRLVFNLRAENLHRTYPELFAASRCLVPFTGFYEWAKRSDGSKEPYLFRPAGGPLCSFAGLWMTSAHPDGRLLQTCTVITTKPNAVVAPIHDRMPVILDPDAARTWLYADAEHDELRLLLAPYPDEHLIAESLHTSQQTALF